MPGHRKITTTVIGAYPKPEYLKVPSWFDETDESTYCPDKYTQYLKTHSSVELQQKLKQATCEILEEQINLGLDVISDGELARENYIYYFCRHLSGFDFNHLSQKNIRANLSTTPVPTIIRPIQLRKNFCANEWKFAQSQYLGTPVKVTLPGPITILDTVLNKYYITDREACQAIALTLRQEIESLVQAGCRYIQIDEPVWARKVDQALEYGVGLVQDCFRDLPSEVTRIVHICCGYPNYLDQKDYAKADPSSYFRLAPAIDQASEIDTVSLEDAHHQNDLKLFELFPNTHVILGVISVANSSIESPSKIQLRALEVVKVLGSWDRLSLAPDCGLGMLPRKICQAKLRNLQLAVAELNLG